MVALSRTNRGILGFIGNLQTISLWGIFLVITAAFIFLAFYAKASTNNTEQVINDSLTKENIETTRKSTTISYRHKKQNLKTGHKMIRMVSIILLVSSISAAVSATIVKIYTNKTKAGDTQQNKNQNTKKVTESYPKNKKIGRAHV